MSRNVNYRIAAVVIAAVVASFAAMAPAASATTSVAPSPPVGLAANAGNTTIALTWIAPSGGSPVSGYNLYEGTSSGGESTTPVNGTILITTTSATVRGLTNGTAYFFTVEAVDASQESSGPSNEATATPATLPGPATGLTAKPANTSITLSWTPPASDGGSPVIGYNVFQGTTSGGESTTPLNFGNVTSTSYIVTGLTNGTAYFFTVEAVNSVGSSAASNEATATPAITAPGAPTGLTAKAGNTMVSLTWTAPTSDGGSTITGYNVYQGTSAGGESTTPVNSSLIGTTSYTVTGLTNKTAYYFIVEAVNGEGSSAASNEVSATPATPPSPPTSLTATARNASVNLTWTAPSSDGGSAITGYNVYEGTTSGGESGPPVNGTPTTTTSYTVTGLTNGTTYYFIVEAVNAAGSSAGSNEASAMPVTTPPDPPTSLTAAIGDTTVSLRWTAPTYNGGSAIAGYEVYEGTTSGGESDKPINGTILITGTSAIVTGLTNQTQYFFTVAAVNAAGLSSIESNEVSATPATPPDPPRNLIATAGNTSVSLTWTVPASDGGSPVTRYLVYQFPGGTLSPAARRPAAVFVVSRNVPKRTGEMGLPTYSLTVSGLKNGTTYYFTITALNAVGASPTSNQASATPRAASRTSLTLSARKITYGHEQGVKLSVSVSPTSYGSTPNGIVTIKESRTTLCSIRLSSGRGKCSLSSKRLAAGSYSLVANYGGSSLYLGSASAKETLKVVK